MRFSLRLPALVLALAATAALAQYPTHVVKIMVPIPPGGAPDVAARLLGEYLAPVLGQPVVADNRPGSNGNIAADIVVKAAPDGHTLLLGADSGIAINPHIYKAMGFDPLTDLVAVASIASNQFILAVNPAVPARTFQEFIDYARRADPPLRYASGGNGSQHQLGIEMLKQRAGINLVHIPYRGGPPSMAATIAGETQVLFAGAASAAQIRSGQLRALASTGRERSKTFPDLPTIGEFYPDYDVTVWLGLFAPARTPEPVVAKLRSEVGKLLVRADFAQRLNVGGSLEPFVTTPDQFSALIRSDYEKYGKLVRQIGVSLD